MGSVFSVRSRPDMNGPTAKFVKKKIANNKIMIFSKTYCPASKEAKKIFSRLGEKYEVLEVDTQSNGEEIQDVLKEITGAGTVPRVFVGGDYIGANIEVKALYESGELRKLVDKAKDSSASS